MWLCHGCGLCQLGCAAGQAGSSMLATLHTATCKVSCSSTLAQTKHSPCIYKEATQSNGCSRMPSSGNTAYLH
jgi:hypothetical protein